MALYVRPLTVDETKEIERLARSKTAPARLVQRAKVVLYSSHKQKASTIAPAVGLSEVMSRVWIKRFNVEGLNGLHDRARRGRPHTYTEQEYGEVIALIRTNPKQVGEPVCHWSLDRLQAHLNERKGIPIKRSQIRRILKAENQKWQKQRTWLTSPDPEFVEKRGALSSSTPTARRASA